MFTTSKNVDKTEISSHSKGNSDDMFTDYLLVVNKDRSTKQVIAIYMDNKTVYRI